MSTLYEKGGFNEDGEWVENAAWYIGQILTRHAAGLGEGQAVCAKVLELRRSQHAPYPATGRRYTPEQRLDAARAVACTCGTGEVT